MILVRPCEKLITLGNEFRIINLAAAFAKEGGSLLRGKEEIRILFVVELADEVEAVTAFALALR